MCIYISNSKLYSMTTVRKKWQYYGFLHVQINCLYVGLGLTVVFLFICRCCKCYFCERFAFKLGSNNVVEINKPEKYFDEVGRQQLSELDMTLVDFFDGKMTCCS
eukprot:TRINITY_DN957_c0_g1_i5.p2 TRINITY_DN957_c0_g1~~TRINITY_DN957_c0_g1_i5.p2  ORF type:complete len:105 (-),score=8.03 TRINITY_DN957_c0_g1_i5:39-353(-)